MEDNQQCPRCRRKAENISPPGLGEGTSGLRPQDSDSEYPNQEERVPVSGQAEERDNQLCRMVWIQWPGTWDPQDKALVDTGAQCTLMPSGTGSRDKGPSVQGSRTHLDFWSDLDWECKGELSVAWRAMKHHDI